jgi:hypothetical protein
LQRWRKIFADLFGAVVGWPESAGRIRSAGRYKESRVTVRFASFVVLISTLGLAACGSPEPDPAARQAASAAAAAKEKARQDAEARREAERLADLWSYADVSVTNGRQLSAMINSTNDVDTDGKGAHAVRLVFRDHTSWGRSSYLVLQAGDFDCYSGCKVQVTADANPPKAMAARRPKTDEAIAMFVNDWQAMWQLTTGARRVAVQFPVEAGGTRTATFDVGGLDASKMPWKAAGGR